MKARRLPISSTAMASEGYEGEAALSPNVSHNFNTIWFKTTTLYCFERSSDYSNNVSELIIDL